MNTDLVARELCAAAREITGTRRVLAPRRVVNDVNRYMEHDVNRYMERKGKRAKDYRDIYKIISEFVAKHDDVPILNADDRKSGADPEKVKEWSKDLTERWASRLGIHRMSLT